MTGAVPGAGEFAGWVIGTLITVVVTLSGVIVKMYVDAKKVNQHRLTERDTLIEALNSAKASQIESASASRERNILTQGMSTVINDLVVQNRAFSDVTKLQFEFLKEDYGRMAVIVTSMAEGLRNLSTMSQDMKASVIALAPMVQDLNRTLDDLHRILGDLPNKLERLNRPKESDR